METNIHYIKLNDTIIRTGWYLEKINNKAKQALAVIKRPHILLHVKRK